MSDVVKQMPTDDEVRLTEALGFVPAHLGEWKDDGCDLFDREYGDWVRVIAADDGTIVAKVPTDGSDAVDAEADIQAARIAAYLVAAQPRVVLSLIAELQQYRDVVDGKRRLPDGRLMQGPAEAAMRYAALEQEVAALKTRCGILPASALMGEVKIGPENAAFIDSLLKEGGL